MNVGTVLGRKQNALSEVLAIRLGKYSPAKTLNVTGVVAKVIPLENVQTAGTELRNSRNSHLVSIHRPRKHILMEKAKPRETRK
jgi:hypothetical protein